MLLGLLCGVTKRVDERIDEGVFRWFGHEEKLEIDRIAKGGLRREVCW